MARLKDAMSTVMAVIFLRKSIQVYEEFGVLVMDFVSILTSTIQFSGFVFIRSTRVSAAGGRQSPMSSMFARNDRPLSSSSLDQCRDGEVSSCHRRFRCFLTFLATILVCCLRILFIAFRSCMSRDRVRLYLLNHKLLDH
ncbi:hypothetical protein FF2_032679 [Malus domestica]